MDAPLRARRHRLAPLVFAAFALGLVPWSATLVVALPSEHVARHWDVAWAGFDIGLAAALGSTAFAALRAAPWLQGAAAAAATMLVCDSWFDVLTSSPGLELWLAVAEAALVELPLAGICLWVAVHTVHANAFSAHARRYAAATRPHVHRFFR